MSYSLGIIGYQKQERYTSLREVISNSAKGLLKRFQMGRFREADRYLVMHNQWHDEYRIYGCAMQLDIIEGQVWIQHNSTEIYIDRELIARGVFPQDIVLGFRSPSIRKILAATHN